MSALPWTISKVGRRLYTLAQFGQPSSSNACMTLARFGLHSPRAYTLARFGLQLSSPLSFLSHPPHCSGRPGPNCLPASTKGSASGCTSMLTQQGKTSSSWPALLTRVSLGSIKDKMTAAHPHSFHRHPRRFGQLAASTRVPYAFVVT